MPQRLVSLSEETLVYKKKVSLAVLIFFFLGVQLSYMDWGASDLLVYQSRHLFKESFGSD